MPNPGDVHVNGPLTNLSIGWMKSQDTYVASKVFPVVPVSKASDLYYTYNLGDWTRSGAKKRAPNTESAGGDFTIGTASYNADVYAYHKDVSDQYRANADATINPDNEATDFVSSRMLLSMEQQFVSTYMSTGVWGTDIAGDVSGSVGAGEVVKWSDYTNSDPITDIADNASLIAGRTGFRPNKLVLARNVFDKLKNHPDFIDRVKYGQTPGKAAQITRQIMAELFEVDEVLVLDTVVNTGGEGLTDSVGFMGAGKALLVYSAPTAGLQTPTGGYIFNWTGYTKGKMLQVSKFRMDNLKSDRVEGEMAWDMKVVSAPLGVLFTNLV